MGRHSRRGPARPADAASPAAAAPHDPRGAAGVAGASHSAGASGSAGADGVQDAEDAWSPWEPPPRQVPGAPLPPAHGRGGPPSPAPSVRGGHPEDHGARPQGGHSRVGRPQDHGGHAQGHDARSADQGGPPGYAGSRGPREQDGGWDTWAEQPRDLVARTEGLAAMDQRPPYYDTLDDRGRYRPSAGPGAPGGRGAATRPEGGDGPGFGEGPGFGNGTGFDVGPGSGGGPAFPDGPRYPEGPGGPADGPDDDDDDLFRTPSASGPAALRVGPRRGGKGRLFTGALALAVLVVLGVTVSEQVAGDRAHPVRGAHAAGVSGASGEKGQPVGVTDPSPLPSAWNLDGLSYKQRMGLVYDLSPTLAGPGTFTSVPGTEEPPREGDEFTYRVDIEDELGLNGELFAEAVHKTLNDDRSWAHDGLAFKRVPKGAGKAPDFVVTLASPGTTAEWCARSGLDTTVDNVSCDSASTSRVMINAYRWARGSETYGDQLIHSYRQMLINHEVGHRLGYGHVECAKDGGLAPVMQQQTKFLDHDGIHCRPNAWAYPNG